MDNELLSHELTVSDLTTLIKTTLEEGFYGLRVTGEISNFRPASTGHWFFALKDNNAVISAVMFRGKLWRVPFVPKDGDTVTVTGNIDVYEKRGTYQIVCDTMTRSGTGDILAMLEARKQKYKELGYFDDSQKKPLPPYPTKVGVVTSPTGAALQDILQILGRRAPFLDVIILPAVVQGDGAAASIAERIEEASLLSLCDILIVGRGGGSLEDLLPFSEECVIEAIHNSQIPVVSAVGHEIDWAISDFVADMRAPTPSAAAELVSQGYMELRDDVASMADTLLSVMEQKLDRATIQLSPLSETKLTAMLERKVNDMEYRLANVADGLERAESGLLDSREHALLVTKMQLQAHSPETSVREMETNLATQNKLLRTLYLSHLKELTVMLDGASSRLKALDPLAILKRGYSVVTGEDGKIVTKAKDLSKGMTVDMRFEDGKRKAVVKE